MKLVLLSHCSYCGKHGLCVEFIRLKAGMVRLCEDCINGAKRLLEEAKKSNVVV